MNAQPLVIQGIDDLRRLLGQELGVSDWFAVDQARIDAFAQATLDRQWIHCDGERAARESRFGTTVAHGFLTLSLGPHLCEQIVQYRNLRCAINYGLNKVRFPQAVPAGSRIRLRLRLDGLEEVPAGVQMLQTQTFEIEGQTKPACVAQWIVRLEWNEGRESRVER